MTIGLSEVKDGTKLRAMKAKLILLRHGESAWNKENRFTGWVDVDLSEAGVQEAQRAGRFMKQYLSEQNVKLDQVFVSILRRAVRTLWIGLEQMEEFTLPVTTSWRLNERHYGALQGLNKSETAKKYGEEQVKIWRRSYDVPPPEMSAAEQSEQKKIACFRSVPAAEFPNGESLATTLARVMPFWNESILPALQKGQNVLIVAHGNSLRSIIQHLEKMSREEILELNVPTATPLVYDLDLKGNEIQILKKQYLGDAAEIEKAQAKTAKA